VKLNCNVLRLLISLCRQVYEEFCTSSHAHSVEKLIETFVQAKSTGTEKPGEFHSICDYMLSVIITYVIFYL